MTRTFEEIISVENLLVAWQEFLKGKRSKPDVQLFGRYLMNNVYALHEDLRTKRYRHGGYYHFRVADPKLRDIHKASVVDRLVHHAVYRILYPFFDRTFIADSFSCRLNKGTHRALDRFWIMAQKVSRNHRRTCWVLKLDVRKFFANIDHLVLKEQLRRNIPDASILWLLNVIIESFQTSPGVGLPLGNLTSQLLVNIYMNDFDQFVKHKVKAKHYLRYADDMVMMSEDRDWLCETLPKLEAYLRDHLHLALHPDKTLLQTVASGVDFLGWTHFPDHRVLRNTTKQRMIGRLHEHLTPATAMSYLGLMSHGNTAKLQEKLVNDYWMWTSPQECDILEA